MPGEGYEDLWDPTHTAMNSRSSALSWPRSDVVMPWSSIRETVSLVSISAMVSI